jgi:dihydroxyacetone kinase-like protein
MDVATARAWIAAFAAEVARHKDRLTQLDSAIGDADHGINMHRGFTAVLQALESFEPTTVGQVLQKTGITLISTTGGASGPLFGAAFRAAAKKLDTPHADASQFLTALRAGLESVQALGAAVPGDKTMVDALAPAVDAFEAALTADESFAVASARAADVAFKGAQATIGLQARKGRASYLGPRSIGHQDPGTMSTTLMFRTLAEVTAR